MQNTRFWWLHLAANCLAMCMAVSPAHAQTTAATEQSSPSTTPGDKHQFAATVEEDEKAWLAVDGNKLLALYRSDTSGKAHGAVLIIPQTGRYPNAAGAINTLRRSLADHHWHTLALDLASHSKVHGSVDEQQVQKTIAAGIEYLNQQGIYNIAILGEGIGAAHVLSYAATLGNTDNSAALQQVRALILLNAQNAIPNSKTNTLGTFNKVKLPILDAYINGDLLSKQQAEQRRRAARKHNHRYYQQIRLARFSSRSQSQQQRVTKRIRGWLDRNIAGFVVRE